MMRLRIFYRRIVWHLGFYLRTLGKYFMDFGEKEIQDSWSIIHFTRLPFAQIEIVGMLFGTHCIPEIYRGAIIGASFKLSKGNAKKNVVFHLNWIATKTPPFGLPGDPWIFGGRCDIVVDPVLSPPHELPDGTLWFMWPDGNYGVIHFDKKKHLRFAGDSETPRIYKYF